MTTKIDTFSNSAASGNYQNFIPHTNNYVLRNLDREMKRGLTQEQVALFRRLYGKDYFKPNKSVVG